MGEHSVSENYLQQSIDDSSCRICMQSASESQMVDIFNHNVEDLTLAEAISLLGAVEILKCDELPKVCCKECLCKVESAYELRLQCQESDRQLRTLLFDFNTVIIKDEPEHLNDIHFLDIKQEFPLADDSEPSSNDDSKEYAMTPTTSFEDIKTEDTSDRQKIGGGDVQIIESENINSDDSSETELETTQNDKDSENDNTNSSENPAANDKFANIFEVIPAILFSCCGCKSSFKTSKELLEHGRTVHAGKETRSKSSKNEKQCKICRKTLKSNRSLRKHQQSGSINYRCKTCGEVFANRQRVCIHHKRMHNSNANIVGTSWICCGCNQKFNNAEELKTHSATVHLPEKLPPDEERPFICEICYKNYPSDLSLYNHQKRLEFTKKYQCTQCGKMFGYANILRDHELSHTGEKLFKCPKCPKAFVSEGACRKHIQRHNVPINKFKCKICDRSYGTRMRLQEHEHSHTGERPFVCPHCPASFNRSGSLVGHIRTHTDQRDYPCPECDKRFRCCSDRTKHIKFCHQKQRPYPCFFCPKQYPRKDYRRKHMESVHPSELEAKPIPAIELAGSIHWK